MKTWFSIGILPIILIGMLVAAFPLRADIALVDTAGEAGLSMSIAETGPTSVTISNFTVSAMANVLVVLVEDKGASAVNSEPVSLTWGSQTILKAIAQDNSDITRRGSSIYYLFNPTPGTNNLTAVVANSPADVEMTAFTLSGVDTTVVPKTGGVPVTGSSGSLTFNVPGVVAGSWAAVNSTWASTIPTPAITGTGGTTSLTSLLVTTAGTSSIMTAGYISGLSGGTVTFAANWSGNQKDNFAAAVFTPLTTTINLTAASAMPIPVTVGSNVLLSVTASSTSGSITSIVVNARSIGGSSALPLNFSSGNVYTNSTITTISSPGAILPVTIRDNVGNTLAGSVQVTVQTIADMQIDAFNKAYLIQTNDASKNTYLVYYSKSLTNGAYDGTWTLSLDIQGEEDAFERTGNPQQQQLINSLCTTWLILTPPPWSWDGWNDDIGWFSLALARGYQMTGNTNFLNAAQYGFNFAFSRGWDTNYNNGGIWEQQPANMPAGQTASKNPLACDSLLQTVCMLYQSTSNAVYLAQAQQIYSWVRTNLFNPNTGQVYGSIATNGTVDTSANLYNQGTFVDCANLLHNITGQQFYYNDALIAVEYTRNHLTSNGIFNNGATYLNTWAAEFARGLGHFVKDNSLWSTYYPWMLANANAAWGCRRTDYNVSWNAWTQTTPTNDVIANWDVNAVAMTQVTPASEPGLINCTNQLHGTIIGTVGSWNNGGNTVAKVFDGNLNTYFDAPSGSVNPWAGLDFGVGVSNVIGQINYWPRIGYSGRMLGGMFQGDSTPLFSHPVTLFTIATAPPENNIVTPQTITNTNAFRCVRYVSADSSGNVAEIQFFSLNPPFLPATPKIIGIVMNGSNGLSFSAINGTPGGVWTLMQSTNVSLPMGQWQTIISGTFDGSGNLFTNLANTATNLQEFYILKVQ
ncbi:MAG TPA: glycoside hydrolase family 76 protein [Verrucomicrobiae bacterium]|nr:glycoside hydrolase family 76 protein [Verrucomicrobiae bacterium]